VGFKIFMLYHHDVLYFDKIFVILLKMLFFIIIIENLGIFLLLF